MSSFFTHNSLRTLITGFMLCFVIDAALPVIPFVHQEPHVVYAESQTPRPAPSQATQAQGSSDKRLPPDKKGINAYVTEFIGNLILTVASGITWLGGKLLDTAIQELILNMGNHFKGTSVGGTINNLWTMIRDICNLAFIFGFIYIGIRTIIDADSNNAKRVLAQIIIGALLINFSLFIVKFVIDVSNYVSVEIYNSLIGESSGTLAENFANQMGISGYYKTPNPEFLTDNVARIAFYVLGALLFIVAGFVFAAGAILLIVRIVALTFIMIFSPVLFAATVFPATAQYASMLWSKLFSYSFFAPAYLLLLIVSFKMMSGFKAIFGTAEMSVALSNQKNGVDTFSVILNFGIVILFLIMSLQIAHKFGIVGADKVLSVGKDLRNRGQKMIMNGAGGATFGAGAALGRATVGRLGNKISDSDKLKDQAARRGLLGWAARQTLKGSRVVADSSFDARNVGGVGNKLGIGEGAKGGYQTKLKETKEKGEKFARSLGEVDDTDVRVMARKKEMQDKEREQRREEEELQIMRQSGKFDAKALGDQREKIEKIKRDVEDAKIKYESEKQRRIIGSTYAQPKNEDVGAVTTLSGNETTIGSAAEAKKELDDAWKDYLATTDEAAKKRLHADIQKKMDELKKRKEKLAELKRGNDGGYAGVLEKDRLRTSWPTGTSTWDNRKAGKEIRKTAEKGLPKKKDD